MMIYLVIDMNETTDHEIETLTLEFILFKIYFQTDCLLADRLIDI